MNKKQFLKVITEVVRREVKKEVKKIFIREQSSPQMSLTDQAGSQSKDIKYTKNKSLNDVLNETVGLAKNEKSDFPTVGGGTFDTARMTDTSSRININFSCTFCHFYLLPFFCSIAFIKPL